jgi:NADPH:quinone reductase-like Zn-dependent oxidoreductase
MASGVSTMVAVTAAAIGNPGLSSWAALKERAKLARHETVLVNGATGTAGRLAIQIAKFMGASKVVATGRNPEALAELSDLGADVVIPMGEVGDEFEDALKQQFADGVDVVLDYVWGKSAERIITAAAKAGEDTVPIRFVQIGAMGGSDISLPSAALRSTAISLMGSGIGSIPLDRMIESIGELMRAAVPGGFRIATEVVPLREVDRAWNQSRASPRIVFQIE